MRLTQITENRQQQVQRTDPRQILASEILTWALPELDEAVEREMAENPALEPRDDNLSTADAWTPTDSTPEIMLPRLASSFEPMPRTGFEDEFDPLERLTSGESLHDHLRHQVGQVADSRLAPVVRCLIEYIDERGYLLADIREIADRLHAPMQIVERALTALQRMEPTGVGARDLRECLCIQCAVLEEADELCDTLPRRILELCWDELIAHRDARIAQRLQRTISDIQQAMRFLQRSLTPYPASGFRSDISGGQLAAHQPIIRPDIVFQRTPSGITIEITRNYADLLRIAPAWERLASEPDSRIEDAMRRYSREQVERARSFVGGLARRGRTLYRLADALVQRQQGFIETGERSFLRPLTRQMLAEELDLDESVISRAVADKWAQIATGEIVPLDAFFGTAHAIRDALVRIIANENSENPLNDDEIVAILAAQGFPVARRTVAKYRSLERILPTRLRRRDKER